MVVLAPCAVAVAPLRRETPPRRSRGETVHARRIGLDRHHTRRAYAKTPSFTLAVIATLALGIGASTAIFSMVNGILLQPLPLHEPHRLVYINELAPNGNRMSVAWPTYLDWTTRVQSVESIADSREEALTYTGIERAQRIRARRTTAGFLTVIGARPALGRDFSRDADRPNAPGEVLVSDGFWRTQLGADANVVGRTMTSRRHDLHSGRRDGF